MNQHFPSDYRLRHSIEFKRVLEQGNKLKGRCINLFSIENGLAHPRIGISVGKRRVKLAVERNRIKRLVRESFRLHCRQLPKLDIVALAYSGITELTNQEIQASLAKLWKKLSQHYNTA